MTDFGNSFMDEPQGYVTQLLRNSKSSSHRLHSESPTSGEIGKKWVRFHWPFGRAKVLRNLRVCRRGMRGDQEASVRIWSRYVGFNRAPLKRKVACDLTAIIHGA